MPSTSLTPTEDIPEAVNAVAAALAAHHPDRAPQPATNVAVGAALQVKELLVDLTHYGAYHGVDLDRAMSGVRQTIAAYRHAGFFAEQTVGDTEHRRGLVTDAFLYGPDARDQHYEVHFLGETRPRIAPAADLAAVSFPGVDLEAGEIATLRGAITRLVAAEAAITVMQRAGEEPLQRDRQDAWTIRNTLSNWGNVNTAALVRSLGPRIEAAVEVLRRSADLSPTAWALAEATDAMAGRPITAPVPAQLHDWDLPEESAPPPLEAPSLPRPVPAQALRPRQIDPRRAEAAATALHAHWHGGENWYPGIPEQLVAGLLDDLPYYTQRHHVDLEDLLANVRRQLHPAPGGPDSAADRTAVDTARLDTGPQPPLACPPPSGTPDGNGRTAKPPVPGPRNTA